VSRRRGRRHHPACTKGLTHGEICAHLEEIYGAKVSKETITRITDAALEGLAEWQNRPLDAECRGSRFSLAWC
jgi:transposase-like protein